MNRSLDKKRPAGEASGLLRIGFLPCYVNYYEGICAEFPREKQAVAERCAAVLGKFGEVCWDGRLVTDVPLATAAGAALARQAPDVVVVVTTIAVFGAIPLAALRPLACPILLWNAQGLRTVGKGYSMVEIVRQTGQIGTQALANTLLREGRRFRVVTGYEKSQRTTAELGRIFTVARAVAAVKRARLLAIGETFPMMTDIALDEAALRRDVGATVTHVSGAELTERYEATAPSGGAALEKGGTTRTQAKACGYRSDLTADEWARSARLCAAVESLVKEHRADGGTLNCHGATCLRNPAIGITACYSLGVQNSQGRPFTCTGDLPTALAMLLLKSLTGVAMYTEVQVMDERRRAVVIANSGEGEEGIRRKGSQVLVRGNANFTGLHGRGASFAYPLRSGPATIVSFTPFGSSSHEETRTEPSPGPSEEGKRSRYRLIVAEGRILQDQLREAGALAGFFRFRNGDLSTAYTRWLEAGPVHHAATTTGHWGGELRAAAEWLGWEFVLI